MLTPAVILIAVSLDFMMRKPFIKLSGNNHTVKETDLIGFSLTESVYPANLRMPRHTS